MKRIRSILQTPCDWLQLLHVFEIINIILSSAFRWSVRPNSSAEINALRSKGIEIFRLGFADFKGFVYPDFYFPPTNKQISICCIACKQWSSLIHIHIFALMRIQIFCCDIKIFPRAHNIRGIGRKFIDKMITLALLFNSFDTLNERISSCVDDVIRNIIGWLMIPLKY